MRMWIGLFSCFLSVSAVASPAPGGATAVKVDRLAGKRLADKLLLASDRERQAVSSNALAMTLRRHGARRAALRADFVRAHNGTYTNELPQGAIKDQKSSGRCWIFSSMNVLERDVELRTGKPVLLSRAYVNARNLQAEAYEMIRSGSGATFIGQAQDSEAGEGGYFQWATQIVDKYGVVPQHVMRDFADSKTSATVLKVLQTTIAEAQAKLAVTGRNRPQAVAIVSQAQAEVDRTIARAFTGKEALPTEFLVDGKKYSPKSYAEHLGIKGDDYVSLEDTRAARPGWRRLGDQGIHGFAAYNTRNVELMKLAVRNAIDQGKKVYVAAPVGAASAPYMISSEELPQLPAAKGIMSLGAYDYKTLGLASPVADRAMNQKQNLYPANHAMTIVGYDLGKDGKVVKWKVENSWGPDAADHGIQHMYDDFFTSLVEVVSVPKSALPREVASQLAAEKQIAANINWDPK